MRLEKTCWNAIRLPTGDLLERGIEDLLTRPPGRPSYAPLVRGKVEHHLGGILPRVDPPLTATSSIQPRCGRQFLSGPSWRWRRRRRARAGLEDLFPHWGSTDDRDDRERCSPPVTN